MAFGGNTGQRTSPEDSEEERFAGRKIKSSLDLLARINDEFLTCQICFETYTCPKSLNCQHTFCKKCLQDYLTPNATALQCPTCRCVQPLTNNGIQSLKDNFFISSMSDMLKTVKEISNEDKQTTSLLCDTCDEDCRKSAMSRCLDCTDFLCSDCSIWHKRTKLTRGHKIVSLPEFESGIHNKELKTRAKIYCTVHEGEAAKMYCKTCECPICHECVESGHSAHNRCSLKDEVLSQSLQIEKLLVYAESKTDVLQDMLKSMKEIIQHKQRSCDEAESQIIRACSKLIAAITRRKQELTEELHDMQEAEAKQVNADADAVEMQISSLVSCAEFSKKVLDYGTPKEILVLNGQMTHMLRQLLESHPALKYHKENRSEQTEFTFDAGDLRKINEVFGKIGLVSRPFPDSVDKVLRRLDTFCVRNSSEVRNVRKESDNQEPTDIKLIKQMGKQGDSDGEFESTPNLAVNSVGEVITSDSDACRIQIFDPQGCFKDSFKTEVKGKCLHPSGIAVLRNDDIAVCCDDQVYVWTYEGKLLQGFGRGHFSNCNSIVVDSKNRMIVTDMSERMAAIFESDGTFVAKFDGGENGSDGRLVEPRYVACDSKDNIIISDGGNCTIKKFNKKGELICVFGEEGSKEGQFQGPRGVCSNTNDNIIVADCWNHRVDLFTAEGTFIRHLMSGGDGLHFPWSVAITSTGRLILSEDYSWAVKIFSIPEYRISTSSAPPEGDVSSPATLIRGLELMSGHFDMSKILNSKLSRWLKSSAGDTSDIWRTLKIPHSSTYTEREKPLKQASRSKSFTSGSSLTNVTIDRLQMSKSGVTAESGVPPSQSSQNPQNNPSLTNKI